MAVDEVGRRADTGIFDALHPPEQERIDDCVHCGFCLPTCPTYALWGEEMDSPRGRIYLMKLGREGTVPMDDTFVGHMDACLGCLACVTACPSGVQYNELIEAVRPQIERHHRRSWSDRAFRSLVFALFPHPQRLRVAAVFGTAYQRLGLRGLIRRSGLLERMPARLRAMESLLPPMSLRHVVDRAPEHVAAVGDRRLRVGMLTGCVQRVFFGDVNAATARVLAADGCEIVIPQAQACCGALSGHTGREPEAMERAKALIDTFLAEDLDRIVVNVAGCGSAMKDYVHLLRDDPDYAEKAARFSALVRDVSEILAEVGPRATRHPVSARIAYHDACHLGHAQGVRAQPREVLRAIPGVELLDVPEAALCCGSAGVYNLLQPQAGEDLGRRKVAAISSVRPDAVVTSNAGCLLQIRRFLDDGVPLLHPVQVIDASIRGRDPVQEAGRR